MKSRASQTFNFNETMAGKKYKKKDSNSLVHIWYPNEDKKKKKAVPKSSHRPARRVSKRGGGKICKTPLIWPTSN